MRPATSLTGRRALHSRRRKADGQNEKRLDARLRRGRHCEYARVASADQRSTVEVERLTNYVIGRVLKENNRFGLGVLATGVERSLTLEALRDLIPNRAYVAGGDGYFYIDSGLCPTKACGGKSATDFADYTDLGRRNSLNLGVRNPHDPCNPRLIASVRQSLDSDKEWVIHGKLSGGRRSHRPEVQPQRRIREYHREQVTPVGSSRQLDPLADIRIIS
jgi:hypothetical protein